MVATTGYQAGVEANAVILSYARESIWGVPDSAATFKTLRYISETLAGTKTRTNPNEQIGLRSKSPDTTTAESAGGGINLAFSAGTYDDLLAGCVGNEWVDNVLTDAAVPIMFTLQKRYGDGLYLVYPGSYVSAAALTMNVGGFISGSLTFLCKEEDNQDSPANTIAIAPATTGDVIDTVGMFGGVKLGGQPIATIPDQLSLTMTNANAAGEYGLGSPAAQGMLLGTFTGTGALRTYFRDFDTYSLFKSEDTTSLEWTVTDHDGYSYDFLLPAIKLMNPKINSGGRGTAVMANYTLELQPDAQGRTIVITRTIPAPPAAPPAT